MQEFEGIWLDVDVAELEGKLKELGAERVGEYLYRRKVFDYPDLRLDSDGAWVRLRDEGEKVTLTFKKRIRGEAHGKDEGMIEHEVEVSDFETTARLLESIGLALKFYEENKRVRWQLDGVEFDFDTWPMLETYLEIESSSDENVDAAAQKLGLDLSDKFVCSTMQIYEMKGINEKDYKEITFERCIKR
ncbi:hypothetical protein CL652_03040 [bacterium]|nr:hypothetical protein [bacterium]|tara:strand:- start:42061 stop:42627 length:567 start_codon:yes stop_codon:yes gene_type:complete